MLMSLFLHSNYASTTAFTPLALNPVFYGDSDNYSTSLVTNEAGIWPSLAGTANSYSSNNLQFNGTSDYMDDASSTTVSNSVEVQLPEGQGELGNDVGFVNTGLDYDPITGYFIVGNSGGTAPEPETTRDCSLVVVDVDFDASPDPTITKIYEFDLKNGNDSVQGVAYDDNTDTYLALRKGVSSGTSNVLRLNKTTGAILDTFTVDLASNGLAFDSTNNYFITMLTDGTVKRWNATTGVVVDTLPSSMTGSNLDMIQYDEANEILWYSRGANGSNGLIRPYSVANDTFGSEITITGSEAIEGIVLLDDKLYVSDDGYLHNGGSDINALIRYDLDVSGVVSALVSEFTKLEINLILDKAASQGATTQIYGLGDPVNEKGVAIYSKSSVTDTIRVILNDGSSLQALDFVCATDLTTESIITVKIDFDNDEVIVLQNGEEQDGGAKSITTVTISSLSYNTHSLGSEPGGGAEDRYWSGTVKDLVVNTTLLTAVQNNNLGNYWVDKFGLTWNDITEPVINTNTVLPVISGTEEEGATLSTTNGSWDGTTPITYTYQWLRSGVPISGATSSSYVLVSDDVGETISVAVTPTNEAGTGSAATSASTGVIAVSSGFLPTSITSLQSGIVARTSTVNVSSGNTISTVEDISANGNDVTGYGSPSVQTGAADGNGNNAFEFIEANSNSLTYPGKTFGTTTLWCTASQDFTYMASFKFDDASNVNTIFAITNESSNSNKHFHVFTLNNLLYVVNRGSVTTVAIDEESWNTIAIVWNGGTLSGSIYINGGTATSFSQGSLSVEENEIAVIGARVGGLRCDGLFVSSYIFDSALSITELNDMGNYEEAVGTTWTDIT